MYFNGLVRCGAGLSAPAGDESNQRYSRVLKWRTPSGPQLRHCGKVTIAAIAAYALTLGGREYVLFSMLGAALVVGGSVGEDLNTSLNRVRGTLAGTAVGITIAYTLGTSIWSLGIGVALLTWISLGLGWGIPAARVGIAMALVLCFAEVADPAHYGVWRLVNTIIGISVGFAVSRLVWPIRGGNDISDAIDRALTATRAALDGLARGVSADALLPLQTRVLDALAAVRTARKNAFLERRIDPGTDVLQAETIRTARMGIAVLGTSITFEELVRAGARTECLHAARQAIASLAADAQNAERGEHASGDFAAHCASALREAQHPDVEADTRTLLIGLLTELQRIHAELQVKPQAASRTVDR